MGIKTTLKLINKITNFLKEANDQCHVEGVRRTSPRKNGGFSRWIGEEGYDR